MKFEQDIFKKGSTTYYWSSKLFPRPFREDVTKLYSFVRTADDYVDEQPTKPEAFFALKTGWKTGQANGLSSLNKRVLANMVQLAKKYNFEPAWVDAFLSAMESDLLPSPHKTLKESQQYIYGSAGVIGLMMSRIMGLPKRADTFALMQGNAMQWVNFIRDLDEDNNLGRNYFPEDEIKKFGFNRLSKQEAMKRPDEFAAFMRLQISRYREWQETARRGFRYIPRRLRVPLKTAVDMYDWTARQIEKDPLVVFERKVKPTRLRVVIAALRNCIHG